MRRQIKIESDKANPCPRITVDGRTRFDSEGNFPIELTVARKTFRLMQNPGHSHFAIVRDKLNWGSSMLR